MSKFSKLIPGIILSLGIATVAILINKILPVDLIGSALIALLLGMLLNPIITK